LIELSCGSNSGWHIGCDSFSLTGKSQAIRFAPQGEIQLWNAP
jgi:hypothetical protein